MKKTFMRVLCMVFAVAVLASCSKDEESANASSSALLSKIPADADYAVVGDLKTVLESAGIKMDNKGFTLPDYILDEIPGRGERALDQMNEELSEAGVDFSTVALFGYIEAGYPIVVAHLNDAAKCADFLEDELGYDKSERNGLSVFTNIRDYDYGASDVSCMIIDGSYVYSTIDEVYVYDGRRNPKRDMLRWIEAAKSANFSTTAGGQYIARGNVGGAAVHISSDLAGQLRYTEAPAELIKMMSDTYITAKFDLSSDEALVTAQWLDANGSPVDWTPMANGMTTTGTINKEAVEYLSPNTTFVYGLSLAGMDWDQMMETMKDQLNVSRDEAVYFDIATTYLKNLEGTVVVGAGFNNGLHSLAEAAEGYSVLQQVSLSMAIQTKPGKARKMLNDLTGFMDQAGISYYSDGNGICIQLPGDKSTGDPITIYVSAFDNMLVASNEPIRGKRSNAVAENVDFSKSAVGAAAVFPKSNQLVRDLGLNCGAELVMLCDMNSSTFTLSLKALGSKDNLLTTIIKNIFAVAHNSDEIEDIFRSHSRYYNSYAEPVYWDTDSVKAPATWEGEGYEVVEAAAEAEAAY